MELPGRSTHTTQPGRVGFPCEHRRLWAVPAHTRRGVLGLMCEPVTACGLYPCESCPRGLRKSVELPMQDFVINTFLSL